MWLVRNPCTKMGYILLLKEPCRETAVCSDVATLNINDFGSAIYEQLILPKISLYLFLFVVHSSSFFLPIFLFSLLSHERASKVSLC